MININSYKQLESQPKQIDNKKQNMNEQIQSYQLDVKFNQISQVNKIQCQTGKQQPELSPQLQSQELFFNASLKYTRKKKIDNYFLFYDQLIGRGSFAKVYKGMNIITYQIVAIKVMQMRHIVERKLYSLLQAEIDIFKSLKHANILRCYDILITDNNCYIITELCNNGQLKEFIKKQSTTNNQNLEIDHYYSQFEPLIYDIYQGLLYLQRKNIIHRDIKMSNILVKDGVAKIADFGFALFSKDLFVDGKIGSPIYMAPQSVLNNIYGPKTDVWAFGILLYQFFHGFTPFQSCENHYQLQLEIKIPFSVQKIAAPISKDAQSFICSCLTFQLQYRPFFKELWTSNYIKQLRLKTYIKAKKFQFYKQVKSCKDLQKIEDNSPELKIKQKNKQFLIIDNSSQEQQGKYNDDEGYSFEDFLKMNNLQEEKKCEQNINNNHSSQKVVLRQKVIKCSQIKQNQTQKQNVQQVENSIKQQVDKSQRFEKKAFECEMQEFYKKAEQMMKDRQNKSNIVDQISQNKMQLVQTPIKQNSNKESKVEQQIITTQINTQILNSKSEVIYVQSVKDQFPKQQISQKIIPYIYLSNELAQTPQILIDNLQKKQLINIVLKDQHYVQQTRPQQNQDQLKMKNEKITNNLKQFEKLIVLNDRKITDKKNDQIIHSQQKQLIDFVLLNLEIVRLIGRYLRFTQKLNNKYQDKKNENIKESKDNVLQVKLQNYLIEKQFFVVKQSYQMIFSSINLRKQILLQEQLYKLCNKVLMRRISQIIFCIGSQKDNELIQIIKSQKQMLKNITSTNKDVFDYKDRSKEEAYQIKDYKMQEILQNIYRAVKIIQEPITNIYDFIDTNYIGNDILVEVKQLCWISIWLAVLYNLLDLLEQLNQKRINFNSIKTENKVNNIDTNQFQQKINNVTKSIQNFQELYQNFINNWSNHQKSQQISNNQQNQNNLLTNMQTRNQSEITSQTANIKTDINYFYQLIYQIDLKRLNHEDN